MWWARFIFRASCSWNLSFTNSLVFHWWWILWSTERVRPDLGILIFSFSWIPIVRDRLSSSFAKHGAVTSFFFFNTFCSTSFSDGITVSSERIHSRCKKWFGSRVRIGSSSFWSDKWRNRWRIRSMALDGGCCSSLKLDLAEREENELKRNLNLDVKLSGFFGDEEIIEYS